MIHFIIEGVLGTGILTLAVINYKLFRMIDHVDRRTSERIVNINTALDLQRDYDEDIGDHIVVGRIKDLEDYLNIERQSKYANRLPKYIKKSTKS